MMRRLSGWIVVGVALLAGAAGVIGCGNKEPDAPPMATPSVTLSHDRVPAGSALEITYKFVVASAAHFDQDYRVFSQVKDADGERIWDDDHNPPVPTSQWKPGQTVEYVRTVFVPVFPYIGDATLEIGLHSTNPADQKRLPLEGDDAGQRAYRVARFTLQPATENLYAVYKDGWNWVESSPENSLVEWQWTKKEATFAFKNVKKDVTFDLDMDSPGSPFESQQVQVTMGGEVIDTFTVTPNDRVLRKIKVPAARMGAGEMSELQIVVDKTFVPAQVNAGASRDERVLGVRVFHAFVDGR
jgi:hypothetical protein